MRCTKLVKGRGEVSGAIGVAPVGEHPLDTNSPFGELRSRLQQEARGRRFSLIGVNLDDREPGSVVDGHVDEVVTSAWSGTASLTAAESAVSSKEPMPTTCWDTTEVIPPIAESRSLAFTRGSGLCWIPGWTSVTVTKRAGCG